MTFSNQTRRIEISILNAINTGLTDKREIFTVVVEALGVPRPTVRRTSQGLIKDLKHKVEVLSGYGSRKNV